MSENVPRSYLDLSPLEISQQLTEIATRHAPEPGRRQVTFNSSKGNRHLKFSTVFNL